jgi:TadE-like protein
VSRNRGSATVELVLVAPLLVLVLVFVTGLGRLIDLRTAVRNAAESAARASSLVAEQRMSTVGSTTALEALAGHQSCLHPHVSVSYLSARSPRMVTVIVTCTVEKSGVGSVLPIPSFVSYASSEVIDVFTFR